MFKLTFQRQLSQFGETVKMYCIFFLSVSQHCGPHLNLLDIHSAL